MFRQRDEYQAVTDSASASSLLHRKDAPDGDARGEATKPGDTKSRPVMVRTGLLRETMQADERPRNQGVGSRLRTMVERAVQLAEDMEMHQIPAHGSWTAIAQIDLATLSGEWVNTREGAEERALVGAARESA